MQASIRVTGNIIGRASNQLLSHNLEGYQNTFPSLLSDRLKNAKFSAPYNVQTGVAHDWEPIGHNMTGLVCQLVPGMYLSGTESQLIHNYNDLGEAGILQAAVPVRAGEEFTVEIWARVQHHPVTASVELSLPGGKANQKNRASMTFNHGHWTRETCRVDSPGSGEAFLKLTVPGNSRLFLDQVHLRPSGQGVVTPALQVAIDQLPCPVLRFPGGSVSCGYHWENGVGPVHLRPVTDDPVFKYKIHYDFGTDEYLELCADKTMRPFITLNTTSATPEQGAAWAAYIRGWYLSRDLDPPSTYFMIGNENHGVWEIGHITGQMYVEQLRLFVPLIREAYPEARVIAIGDFESGGMRGYEGTSWRNAVISDAADLYDVLAVTRYAVSLGDGPLETAMKTVAENVADKAADLDRQVASVRDAHIKCPIGVVEWNYWTRASHNDHADFYEPNDIRHCLYAAGYLNALCRLGDSVEIANHYSLINTMGLIHIHADEAETTDVVKVFNLYAAALPGEVMDSTVDSPFLSDEIRAIDGLCIKAATCTYVFIINFSAHQRVSVTLQDVGVITGALSLSASDILKPVQETEPQWAGSEVDIPPASVTRITCT